MNVMDKVLYGGQVTLIGLCVVFAMLTILIVCIMGMAKVFDAIKAAKENKAKAKAAQAAPAPAPAPAPVVEAAPVVEEVVQDAELIAVIAAAIAAFDNSGKALVVRKVRRVNSWNKTARQEQVYRF